MPAQFDVFQVDPKPIPGKVPGFEEHVGTATWPPSTSTYLWSETDGLLIDALITQDEAQRLAHWISSHDSPLTTIYITHPHADHFLGLPAVLSAFPAAQAVALPEAVQACRGQVSEQAMTVWNGYFPAQLTSAPVIPEPLGSKTIWIGDTVATLVPVGATDTDHSSIVHVPELDLVVAGDVVYNDVHMWLAGSTSATRENWRRALDIVDSFDPTVVVAGHRHAAAPDDEARRLTRQCRRYLDDFEQALSSSATPQELIDTMSLRYPTHGNLYTLWAAAFDLVAT